MNNAINSTLARARFGSLGCLCVIALAAMMVQPSSANATGWNYYTSPAISNPYLPYSANYYVDHYYDYSYSLFQDDFVETYDGLNPGSYGSAVYDATYPGYFSSLLNGMASSYTNTYSYWSTYNWSYDVLYYNYAWSYLF
ncbi:MAG: hypothetical protein MK116_00615 [Phycisphaerales bacterium]|nr:hypothetical protein [Phycisphaerales bacterium]